jgi:hypothetical protein
MPNSVIVKGYQEIQDAERKLLAEMKPSGALGKAVLYATTQMQRGTISRAHRDTGTYAASQTTDMQGLSGSVYTKSNRNPKSGEAASVYGPYEEARGGSHAAYATTFKSDAPGVMVDAIAIIIAELP